MRLLLALLLFLLPAAPAAAHKPSDAYLSLTRAENGIVTGRWDIAIRDLEMAVGVDLDRNGEVTWGELKARHAAIAAHALPALVLRAGDTICPLTVTGREVDRHADGAYDVLHLRAACPPGAGPWSIEYRLFATLDRLHRGLVRVTDGGTTRSAVLGPDSPILRIDAAAPAPITSGLVSWFVDGVRHIWFGYDHMLFVLCLLLPAVLRREDGRWIAEPDLRRAVAEIARVVTAFTVAHSLTLAASAFQVIELPSRLVESAIAATIVLAALNNVVPLVQRRLWVVAFAFGLIHGMGFAGALAGLGLPTAGFLTALLAFNLGIEAGQLAIVAVLLPILALWRTAPVYPRLAMPAGSLAIAVMGGIWLAERAWGLVLVG